MSETPTQRLYAAVSGGDVGTAKQLLNENPDLLELSVLGGTWLHLAARKGHIPMMEMLLAAGLDSNSTGEGEEFPLWDAAANGHTEAARWLLDHGASPRAGRTIIVGVNSGSLDLVRLLAERGADINARFENELAPPGSPPITPLSQAIANGFQDIADYLRASGAN